MKIDLKKHEIGDIFLAESTINSEILTVEDGQVKFSDEIFCEFKVCVSQELVVVAGSVSTTATYICSRCLCDFEEKVVNDDIELCVKYIEDMCIDLTDTIREAIIVRLSVKPLCSEDCKGLCSNCGSNLNEGVCNCSKVVKKDKILGSIEKKSVFEGLDFKDGKIDLK